VWIAAVEAHVEAKFLDGVAALVGAAGDADNSCALDLGDLPTTAPTAPVAAATTTVWPGSGRPMSSKPT
jgi:hypothetical protein